MPSRTRVQVGAGCCGVGDELSIDRAGHALEREQSGLVTALASEWLDRVEEFTSFASGNPRKRS